VKANLSLNEILEIVEIAGERVDRNFTGDPPHVLRELMQKLDHVIARHRIEIDAVIKSSRKKSARRV
jgi:hypothetical protein